MKEKVTSYDISKKLHDLGFECESHCGWWTDCNKGVRYHGPKQIFYTESSLGGPDRIPVKAYDCHDLLMWLKSNDDEPVLRFLDEEYGFEGEVTLQKGRFLQQSDIWGYGRDQQPQNALGLSVIKILEEK